MTRAQLIHTAMRALSMPVTAKVGELQWTADPEYLVDAAGTDLGTSNDRHFYKANDGIAIAVYSVGNYANWYGPILISTDPAATYTTLGETLSVFPYGGLIWTMNHGWHLKNASYSTDLPLLVGSFANHEEMFYGILEQAKVQISRGGFALWP